MDQSKGLGAARFSEWNYADHLMPLIGHFNYPIVWIASILNDSCVEGWGNPQSHIACCSEVWHIS
jgi:hypothetical protein